MSSSNRYDMLLLRGHARLCAMNDKTASHNQKLKHSEIYME